MGEPTTVPQPADSATLQRVRSVLPEIAARGDEIERATKVPLDLLTKLEQAGAFRMCVPKSFGGEELTQMQAGRVIEELATADASVAWHAMVAAGSQILTARLPLESLQEYYDSGPDVWPKTAASPKGIAVPVEGGYRLSGRWPLASGARHFDWVSLGFLVKDGNGIRKLPNGMPDMRLCLVRKTDVRVIETWDAVGLRGTRSDDLEVKDFFVAEAWQGPFFGPSSMPSATLSISMPAATATHHLSIVKGILKGGVGDLARDSLTRKPAFNPMVLMKDDPVFRSRFGEICSRVDGLCSLADLCIAILDACEEEGRDVTQAENARISSAEALVHHEGTALMDQMMMLSGSAGVYMSNPIQRRWRDLRCVAQHQAANIGNYATYAAELIKQVSCETAGDIAKPRGQVAA